MSERYPTNLYRHTSQLIEYFFETEFGAQYYVRFRQAQYQFKIDCKPCRSIFEVSFNPESASQFPDYRVKNTILHLIREFMEEQRAPILYICDNLDGRESERQRLFYRWFAKLQIAELQHDYRIVKLEDYTLILGIIAFKWDTHFNHYFEQIEHI
ncbi:DUF6169 family protein [Dyadobacter sp. CY261]|uniref:DUF6169 family protein n=1 Tax=Dyadobacter sp. CY261 TaxID=2907203 RepID=UPI001F3A0D32|nr:DUF6169 family protein [Dyadobacter sp. CY261]MCF0071170.1 DUF6169 family protein [Dyadobacter sp. CY261]